MHKYILIIGLFVALALRLFLAFTYYGSIDVDNALYVTDQFFKGLNVYETTSYNHTPIWLIFLIIARLISSLFNIPFYGVYKIYAIIADILIGILIFKISYYQLKLNYKISVVNSFLYLFSPVSIIISSLHGQFDSIPLVFLLGAYILLYDKKPKEVLSAILLGIAIAFKTWPIFFLPLYLLNKKIEQTRKLKYSVIVLFVFILPLVPYLFKSLKDTLGNIFLYFGTADFGLAVIFQYFIINKIEPISNIVNLIYSHKGLPATLILLVILIFTYTTIKNKKFNFNRSAVFTVVCIYSFSFKLGAQYLLWIIPFLILSKYYKFYVIYTIATITILILNYQGSGSRALYPMFKFFTVPKITFPWGISVLIWWILCILFYFKILTKKNNI